MATQKKKWLSDDKAYAKRLIDALSGFYFPCLKWLQYILPEDKIHPSLRVQMNIIWLFAMMESLKDTISEIEQYENYTNIAKNTSWTNACNEIRQNIILLTKFFNKFSKEEQVVIIYLRHCLVHGFLTKYNKTTPIYWLEKGQLINPADKSWKVFKSMAQPLLGKNYIATTNGFLHKTMESEFPELMDFIGGVNYLQTFERAILEGLTMEEDDPFFSTWSTNKG